MSDNTDIVLGIDLGTTFSAMSYVNKYGKPEIITNAEGKQTTPSVVHFYDEDACVVGEEAVKMCVIDPDNVVRFIKRQMGEDGYTLDFYDRTYTPQEVSALILKKMKEDAEELLGTDIRDVVITVPAYFNSAQRGATAEAGAIAGLNVLSIINEPTAAAIAYGLDRIGGQRKLLVFDLGGGTFDVTVMEINGTKLTTLASDGNAELGGKDWDDRLVNHVADAFYDKYELDPRDDLAPYQELYERCLGAKIALSTKPRAMIPVNYKGRRMGVPVKQEEFEEMTADLVEQCSDTCEIVLEKAGLTWDDLDEVLLVGGSTRMPMVRRLLTELSGKEPAEGVNPDECVALGASLAGVFRHRPDHPALHAPKDPEKKPKKKKKLPPKPQGEQDKPRGAVIGLAYGGHQAMQQASASDEPSGLPPEEDYDDYEGSEDSEDSDEVEADTAANGLQRVIINDATTHPLGIIVLTKDRQERVVELIPESTPLPHEFKGRFAYAYENMTAVRVEVTEGHGDARDEVVVIGKVELTGLPPRPRGTPIEVYYRYGVDQILSVRVVDVQTGRSQKGEIHFKGGMSEAAIAAARDRTSKMDVD